MGDFRITIDAVGGHGCQREITTGQTVTPCGRPSCPDCAARAFVKQLQEMGCSVQGATLEHWPARMGALRSRGDKAGPVEDLITGVRAGSF